MPTIKCTLLTYREHVPRSNSSTPVYSSDDGRRYHLGNVAIITDAGETIEPAPIGAMWDADWFAGLKHDSGLRFDRNPDGIVLCVRAPGGDWLVDGPSSGGGSWSRTGTIPNVTATPSILQPSYHGWLREGCLVEV